METSYNGWTASPNPADFGGISPLILRGESFAPGVRKGDVHTIFAFLADDLDKFVEPIVKPEWHQADDWGYSYRANRNANNLSCHASGTAIDYNATRHPNNKRGTFTPKQTTAIRKLLRENYRGLIQWGGDYTGTPDEMHFEIIGNASQVAAFVRDLTKVSGPPIIGAIRQRFDSIVLVPATWGYFLGQPQGPEVPTLDGVGRWQEFANGAIYWTPDTGAHVVWGDILKRWRTVGSEITTGFPITDEKATPDTVGRYNHFAGGWSIYWHPWCGAWDVHGWFREAWAASGWELGPWGYPTSGEYVASDGVLAQNFQHGRVAIVDGAVVFEPQ